MRPPLLLLLFCLLAFTKRDVSSLDVKNKPVADDYQACCGAKPVEYTYGQKQIYIPNVFTPNGDGVNDLFMPFINEDVTAVWGFTILSAEGDSILFIRPYFDYSTEQNLKNYAWNGLRKDGTPYKGLFKYRMRVDTRTASKDIIEGTACAILCGPDAAVFQSKEGCFFSDQVSTKGRKDSVKKTKDKKCF